MASPALPSDFDLLELLDVLSAFRKGDFRVRMAAGRTGLGGRIADALNAILDQESLFSEELGRLCAAVGKEGRFRHRLPVPGVPGEWQERIRAVNGLVEDLVLPVREAARVIGAVAKGDLSRTVAGEVEGRPLKGDFLIAVRAVNDMVAQLGTFASEVSRVAREVGTEGKLGGQALVRGASGTWKDLTENVNLMASNLTAQVRNIAEVTTAVAAGDLSRKITVDARNEILELKNTVNTMVDQLKSFASEVTRVAREVGIEGRLGGQAQVPGASGLWRDITDNVNRLAGNLTSQVRAIADVATAVTAGDLSRSIAVQAAGEVAALKDNINDMIRNLRETTNRTKEQDWLKTNLARFTRMLQGQRDLRTVPSLVLSELAPLVSAQAGAFYVADREEGGTVLRLMGTYALRERKEGRVRPGTGLVGQAALEKRQILVRDVPEGYLRIESGLGGGRPLDLVVLPVVFEGEVRAVVELASFNRFSEIHLTFLEQLTESIGIVLNTISATLRTEELLDQSQALTQELRSQQEELTETNRRLEAQASTLRQSQTLLRDQQNELQSANDQLGERARLLAEQKAEVERARAALQEQAEELALSSRYKSEFLANMSHELRTPLNSLLILSKALEENAEGRLSPREVEFAATIHAAGNDLLELINEVLDLAKIESGTLQPDLEDVALEEILLFAQRTFRPVAEGKGLGFDVELGPDLPRTLRTDPRRVQQVIRNLLSNAFKFTERGKVDLTVARAGLEGAAQAVAFRVRDTGIGIAPEKHALIFEAFQQADGTTARRFGGTGLGLSISREIARMLGGGLGLESAPGAGSAFTLYLPLDAEPRPAAAPPAAGAARPGPQPPILEDVNALPAVEDDRNDAGPGDPVILIVEDDPDFAKILVDLAHSRGFRAVVAGDASMAFRLFQAYRPRAVTLDLRLPDQHGWILLDRLRQHPGQAQVPIHIISVEENRLPGIRLGAVTHLLKPAPKDALESVFDRIKDFNGRAGRRLLVVEPREERVKAMEALAGSCALDLVVARGAEDALRALGEGGCDGIVLNPGLEGGAAEAFLRKVEARALRCAPPVLVFPEGALGEARLAELRRYAPSLVLNVAPSRGDLLQEIAVLLDLDLSGLDPEDRRLLEEARRHRTSLAGHTVLLVDDDVRNLFALTAVLEGHGVKVVTAERGLDALAILRSGASVDLVLMDIMLPGMDGLEVTRAIREQGAFRHLPIIALTAKAMKGDREKAMAAGASDYVRKPVAVAELLSVMRVWLGLRPWHA